MATMTIRQEIADLIEKGRREGIKSETIVEEIFTKDLFHDDLVVQRGAKTERPVNISDVFTLATKALKQAEFDGVMVMLSPGRSIKRRIRAAIV